MDMITISAMDFKDINHCFLIVSHILSTKHVTDEEMERLNYVEKTYLQANINITSTLMEDEL